MAGHGGWTSHVGENRKGNTRLDKTKGEVFVVTGTAVSAFKLITRANDLLPVCFTAADPQNQCLADSARNVYTDVRQSRAQQGDATHMHLRGLVEQYWGAAGECPASACEMSGT